MAGILVFADQKNGKFRQVIFEMLGEGKKIAKHQGEELHAVVMGKDIGECSVSLAEAGAVKVYLIDNAQLETYTTDGFSKALAELINQEKPSLVLMLSESILKMVCGLSAPFMLVRPLPLSVSRVPLVRE